MFKTSILCKILESYSSEQCIINIYTLNNDRNSVINNLKSEKDKIIKTLTRNEYSPMIKNLAIDMLSDNDIKEKFVVFLSDYYDEHSEKFKISSHDEVPSISMTKEDLLEFSLNLLGLENNLKPNIKQLYRKRSLMDAAIETTALLIEFFKIYYDDWCEIAKFETIELKDNFIELIKSGHSE